MPICQDQRGELPAGLRQRVPRNAAAEPIYETNLTNRRRRRTTLYFLDALGKPEPDTQTEAAPIADRMEQMAFSLIDNLRRNGIEVQVESLQGVVEKLDALAAGVEAKLVLTYNVC